ncbi:glycosyltransferase family 4 protein [Lapillicoccus jejuensis]|uniref:D-inositol 3-phosphate glycosyltransferase n=1 Tax=Lapillicoccus jejuensis TaxID=402171 RepID=A0A542E6K7_9MICO|nr:glycosyltransferase family 4 protein [Lapillicoccus jejuensis]TQJ10968.1 glycosyltransferase involved in cell wall biosynthesis [Lapillicoccus jejuensis]
MRVVLLVGRTTGGIGTHVGQLADDLRALGHDVRLVAPASSAEHFGWADAMRWWPARPGDLGRPARAARALLRGADVVHAHGLQAAVVAAAATGPGGPPRVVSLHNPPPAGPAGRAVTLAAAAALRSAALVTGASEDLVDLAARLGARRTRLDPVPSPIVPALLAAPVPDAAARAAAAARLVPGAGAAHPLVLTVARVAPQKRLDVLVDAAALAEHAPDVVWAVAGAGAPADLEALHSRARGAVRLLGPRADVADLLRAASLLVVSSDWEARALVVQEAMAAGVPVVATAVGGLPGLLQGTGRLVPPGDPRRLALAVDGVLDELLPDPSAVARMGAAGRALAASWDDGPASARRWATSYAELVRA